MTLEFWFEFASTYSYLSVMRIELEETIVWARNSEA
jgi:2-hydroxychromene-2-carboxylate isomerase